MKGNYTLQLKKRQLTLLEEYKSILGKALAAFDNPRAGFLQSFLVQEKACLLKLNHLNKVISAFPDQNDSYVDQNIIQSYHEVQEELSLLMGKAREKKNTLGYREKKSLMKNHRQNRLYREIKPAYIDIRT